MNEAIFTSKELSMSFWRKEGLAATVGLIGLLSGCASTTVGAYPQAGGTPQAAETPGLVRNIRSEGMLMQPIESSKSLAELLQMPDLVAFAAQGEVLAVRSSADVDDLVESFVQLKQLSGKVTTFKMKGGVVPARDLKTVTDPPIGPTPSTEAELNAPVTMTFDGTVVPAPGDEVIVFGRAVSATAKVPSALVVLKVVHSADGTTYEFSGEPLVDTWKPPASTAEAAALIALVQSR